MLKVSSNTAGSLLAFLAQSPDSKFVIRISFVIRHSSFGFPL